MRVPLLPITNSMAVFSARMAHWRKVAGLAG